MQSSRPDFSYEQHYSGLVCGVDEAGRGPLAGPVVAAAVIIDPAHSIPAALQDSKKMTAHQREHVYEWVLTHTSHATALASVEDIDQMNILQASLYAMQQAVTGLSVMPSIALIDGNKMPDQLPCPAEAIVKGDSLSVSIAAASVLAKVTRDRMMLEIARAYPEYGFERHMGYGTAAHLEALRTHGPCPWHRRSFAPVKALLEEAA